MSLKNQIKHLSEITEDQLEKLVINYKNIEVDRKYNKESEEELQSKFRRVMEITLFGWESKDRVDPKFADELYEKLRIANALVVTVNKVREECSEVTQT